MIETIFNAAFFSAFGIAVVEMFRKDKILDFVPEILLKFLFPEPKTQIGFFENKVRSLLYCSACMSGQVALWFAPTLTGWFTLEHLQAIVFSITFSKLFDK